MLFSEQFACLNCGTSIPELEPRIFSFNSPHGACDRCHGLGFQRVIDPELVVPDPTLLAGRGRPAALEPRHHRLLEAPDRRRRRGVRGRRRQALGAAEEGREGDLPLRHRRGAPPGHLHQPLRPSPLLQGPLRGDRQQPPAPLRGDRLGGQPRADRELHGRAALPAVRGRPAAPGEPRGQGRRHQHRRVQRPLRPRRRRVDQGAGDDRDRAGDRAADRARDRPNGSPSSTTSASATSRWPARPARSPAARRSGSGSRPRSARSLVGVMYVLDEPSIGLHQRDNEKLIATLDRLRDLGNTVIVVEHDEGTMMAADHLVDLGPGAGEHGGHIIAAGTPKQVAKNPASLTGQYLSGKRRIEVPEERRQPTGALVDPRRPRTQPQGRRRGDPARRLLLRHRRLRLGQVDPGQRDAPPRGRQPPAPGETAARRPRRHRRPLPDRQDHQHRPVADRPHAALQPGHLHRRLRPHPPALHPDPGGAGARLQTGPLQLQRQGRPLRGLQRRRPDQDRDALPARRLRPLRAVPRQTLQPRDARGPLQGQEHRRRAGDVGRGRGRVLRERAEDRTAACAPCTTSASTTSASGSRRRPSPAARRSGSSSPPSSPKSPPATPSTSSTSRPPASTSPTSPACWRCWAAWSTPATPWS